MMLKLDKWIMDRTQEAYLWLFDRTGVYVATLCFFVYLPTPAFGFSKYPLFSGAVMVLVAVAVMNPYLLQDKGEYTRYNAVALWAESSRLRLTMTSVIFGVMVVEILFRDIFAISSLGMITYFYLGTVKIRERDKRPFFKPRERTDFAVEASK